MRSIGVLAFLVLASMSSASFDLVMVADNIGSFSGPIPAKIHRYDGDSGVYLGSFNAGYNPINDMAVNAASGELYVLGGNRVMVYDYSTGSVKRQFAVTSGAIKFHNGKLYRASSSNLSEVNLQTGALTVVKNWTSSITDFAFTSTDSYLLFNATSGSLQGFSSTGVAGSTLTLTGFSTSGVRLSGEGAQGGILTVMGPSSGNGTITSFSSYNVNASGFATSSVSGTFLSSYSNSFVDLDKSHLGNWIYGKNGSGLNSLFRVYSGLTNGDTNFATPQVTTAGPIAVVLAPEPGTMIALGAGVLALLRRRRKPVSN